MADRTAPGPKRSSSQRRADAPGGGLSVLYSTITGAVTLKAAYTSLTFCGSKTVRGAISATGASGSVVIGGTGLLGSLLCPANTIDGRGHAQRQPGRRHTRRQPDLGSGDRQRDSRRSDDLGQPDRRRSDLHVERPAADGRRRAQRGWRRSLRPDLLGPDVLSGPV